MPKMKGKFKRLIKVEAPLKSAKKVKNREL
jgi:hypothetical protein